MKWSETYRINSHDTDADNLLRPSGFMRLMQETVAYQMLGEGPSYMELCNMGYTFLMSRMSLVIHKPVHSYETVTVRTWAPESRGSTFNRAYEMLSESGEILAQGKSLWALIENSTRRLTRVGEVPLSYGSAEDITLDTPMRFRIPAEIAPVGSFTVSYRDIDVNHHMNNTVYHDILCGFIPNIESLRVRSISVSYQNEARLGDTVDVLMAKGVDEPVYYFRTVRPDGKINVEARIELAQ